MATIQKYRRYLLLMLIGLTAGCNIKNTDTLISIENMKSKYVDKRNVEVWLPASYNIDKEKRYPVLYMHDGQNLFDSVNAFGGFEWGVDNWVKKLSSEGQIPEVIVVGIWNTPKRFREYMPNKPFYLLPQSIQNQLIEEYHGKPLGDAYLKFIVDELKPYTDNHYRTLSDQEHTYIMGSSMGGLISVYALCEYPDVFHGAGCLSTHWPLSLEFNNRATSEAFAEYFSSHLPPPENHKIYFDYGTESLDSLYEPFQYIIDSALIKKGYIYNETWLTQKFQGAGHNEESWNKRLNIPLKFLLNH